MNDALAHPFELIELGVHSYQTGRPGDMRLHFDVDTMIAHNRQSAHTLGGRLADALGAMEEMKRRRPDEVLLESDNEHQTPLTSYMMVLVAYAAIFNTNDAGVPLLHAPEDPWPEASRGMLAGEESFRSARDVCWDVCAEEARRADWKGFVDAR